MVGEIQLDSSTIVLVVIVNYRTPILTINCLCSLVSEVQSLPGTHVAVVDNDSGDRSVEQIGTAIETEGWGNWVSLIPSAHNGGYAFGNNLVIVRVTTQFDKSLVITPRRKPESSSLSTVGKRKVIGQGVPSASSKLLPAMPTSGCFSMKSTNALIAPGRTCVSGLSNRK